MKKTYIRPRNEVFVESDTALCLGASHNMSPLNNRCIVATCFSGPQMHSVTRGYMNLCAPTLNAAAGMSGNNRPFIVKRRVFPINSMVIGKDGGDGDRQIFGVGDELDPCPTLQTAHHHAVCVVKEELYGEANRGGFKEFDTCSTVRVGGGHMSDLVVRKVRKGDAD